MTVSKRLWQAARQPPRARILVDEQFGATILWGAVGNGYITAMPAEKSRRAEFEFEYGDKWAAHNESFKFAFSKVLMRYNPEAMRQ